MSEHAQGETAGAPGGQEVDAHLEILLRLVASQPEASMAICLTMPGGIVAGHLVSPVAWADRWEKVVSEATARQERSELMAQLPHTVQDTLRQMGGEPDGRQSFIHLVDVTFMSVPAAPTTPVWRGRVSDISGWSLGAPS
ncbi:hypothetical protein ACFYYH_18545 [Streptomyces sp. NPDC002018]|uniref:hypothetical protein n=1 Tax=Streptomyces sp. NPDC002018 TaxID=3364629 RepID=UPI0036C1F16F